MSPRGKLGWSNMDRLHSKLQAEDSASLEDDDSKIIPGKTKKKQKVLCKNCKHFIYIKDHVCEFLPDFPTWKEYYCDYDSKKAHMEDRKVICKKFE
ncbi:MAG: hypothetical protein Nk1A_8410 [Endomicrobiia bacterium]|nr:MAG: hypothetical protein Nk1A_8410 [Endomicrobiia bacterium]